MRSSLILFSLLFLSLWVRSASAISISFSGNCVYGDCSNPVDPLGPPSNYDFSVTTWFADGDVYNLSGNVQDQQLLQQGWASLSATFTLTFVQGEAGQNSVADDIVDFDVADVFSWPYSLRANGTESAGAIFPSIFDFTGYVKGQSSISYMPGALFSPLFFRGSDLSDSVIQSRPVNYVSSSGSPLPPAVYEEKMSAFIPAGTIAGTWFDVGGTLYTYPAPEPNEISLCLSGILALGYWRRRSRLPISQNRPFAKQERMSTTERNACAR